MSLFLPGKFVLYKIPHIFTFFSSCLTNCALFCLLTDVLGLMPSCSHPPQILSPLFKDTVLDGLCPFDLKEFHTSSIHQTPRSSLWLPSLVRARHFSKSVL